MLRIKTVSDPGKRAQQKPASLRKSRQIGWLSGQLSFWSLPLITLSF